MAKSRFGGFVGNTVRSAGSFARSFVEARRNPPPLGRAASVAGPAPNPVAYGVGSLVGASFRIPISYTVSTAALGTQVASAGGLNPFQLIGQRQNPYGGFGGTIQSIAGTAAQASEYRRERTSLLGLQAELATSVPLGRQGLNRLSEIGRDPRLREDEQRHIEQAVAFAEQETRRGKREVAAAESIARQRASQAAQFRSVAHRARSQVRVAETRYQKASATQKQAVGTYRQRFLEARKARRDYASAVLNLPLHQQAFRNATTQAQRNAARAAIDAAQKIIKDAPKTMARTKRAQLQAVGAAKRATAQAKVAQQQVQAARTTYATRAAKAVRATRTARAAQRNIQQVRTQAQGRTRQAMARASQVASQVLGGAAARAGTAALASLVPVVGQVYRGFTLLATGTSTLIKGFHDLAENQNEYNRRFAPYNAAIATAFTRLTFGDMSRQYRLANFNQESAVRLTDAINNMRESFMSFNAHSNAIFNKVAMTAANIAGGAGGALDEYLKTINRVLDKFGIGAQDPNKIGEQVGAGLVHALAHITGIQTLFDMAKAALDWFETDEQRKAREAREKAEEQKLKDQQWQLGPADQFVMDMAKGNFRNLPIVPPKNLPRHRGGFGWGP